MGAILNTKELCRRFGGIQAVDNVNISFGDKGVKSVIGPNGAGKTTLFNIITGGIPVSGGKVFFQGIDITNKPPHKTMHLGICRTFQISSLFPGLTLHENVRIATQARKGGSLKVLSAKESLKVVNEQTWMILERLGLTDQAYQLTRNLSHGDQRILEIAIALAGEPKLLLLDEPTAGMSPGETVRTTNLIKRIAEGLSVVLVEHDMEVVMSISDEIAVMHQGRIIAEGKPEEIRQNALVREAYLGEEE